MTKSRYRLFGVIAALLSIATVPGVAQFSGSVQGTVIDSSSNVIAKAAVTLVNTATQVADMTTADDSGVYRFASLAPGNYEVSAEAPGFGKAKVAFTLQTGETRNIPLSLICSSGKTPERRAYCGPGTNADCHEIYRVFVRFSG